MVCGLVVGRCSRALETDGFLFGVSVLRLGRWGGARGVRRCLAVVCVAERSCDCIVRLGWSALVVRGVWFGVQEPYGSWLLSHYFSVLL